MENKTYLIGIWIVLLLGTNNPILSAQSLEWARTFGGNTKDEALSVFTDDSGNVYTTGTFQGTVDFDPGIGVELLTSDGGSDVFVLKLDVNGDFEWVKSIHGSGNDGGTSICGDNSGNIFVTGYFEGQITFPWIYCWGYQNKTSNGGRDIFIIQFDSNGESTWANTYGSIYHDAGYSIKVDEEGDIITSGVFQGTVDFSNGSGALTSAGTIDVFVLKLDSNGQYKWGNAFGGTGHDSGESVSTDVYGNIIIGGYFSGTVDFDSGPGTFNLSSSGGTDYFICKIDSHGALIWVKSFGGNYDEKGISIGVDSMGNAFVLGGFLGTIDLDPGFTTFNVASTGDADVFIQKLDATGNFLWAKTFGGIGFDVGEMIAVSNSGKISATGNFQNVIDLDPGIGLEDFISNGESDYFVLRLDSAGTFISAASFGGNGFEGSQALFVDGFGNLISTGCFQNWVTFDSDLGTDSLVALGIDDIFIQKLDSSNVLQWVRSIGGNSNDVATCVTLDHFGNAFVTGGFQGVVDFEPGSGITGMSAVGQSDVFVQKLDPSGNLLWAKIIGGRGKDVSNAVLLDANGNSYYSGMFEEGFDFNFGSGTAYFVSKGMGDVFVMKISSGGNFYWSRTFGGAGNDESLSLCADPSGNVISTGYFQDTIVFNPIFWTGTIASFGGNDVFIEKLDGNGNIQWVKSIGGALNDVGKVVKADSYGNIYVLGTFEGQVDFDPGPGSEVLLSNGNEDIFLLKLDGAGNFLWVKTFGGNSTESVGSLFLDSYDNIYTAGSYSGNLDIDPGNGVHSLTSLGGTDIYIQKIDFNGNFIWANSFGGVEDDKVNSISTDELGDIYISGYFQDTVDFDPGTNVVDLFSSGDADYFIQKFSSNGGFIWAYALQGTGAGEGTSLCIDGTRNIYSVGNFNMAINLDPEFPQLNYVSNGGSDYFVHKLSQTTSSLPKLNFGIDVKASPNPTNGLVQISIEENIKNAHIILHDAHGKLIFEKEIGVSGKEQIDIEGSSGVYFLYIITDESKTVIKLVKE